MAAGSIERPAVVVGLVPDLAGRAERRAGASPAGGHEPGAVSELPLRGWTGKARPTASGASRRPRGPDAGSCDEMTHPNQTRAGAVASQSSLKFSIECL